MEIPIPDPGSTDKTLYWEEQRRRHIYICMNLQQKMIKNKKVKEANTFWMSVMSSSLMTLFLLEDPDLELELSKHK